MNTIEDLLDSVPNLRNGAANLYQRVHISAGIDAAYHHLSLGHRCTGGNRLHKVVCEAVVYNVGLAAVPGLTDSLKVATVLAFVRHGMEQAWGLTATDLIAAQTKGDNYVDANTALIAAVDNTVFADVADYDAVVAMPERTKADLVKLGMALPPVTGAMLARNDMEHHFLEPNRAAYRVIWRQITGGRGEPPLGLSSEAFEDVAFHKACHTLQSNLMVHWSRLDEVKENLLAYGLGGAAVRLPGAFPSEAAASAIRALVQKSAQIGALANVNVSCDNILAECEEVTVGNMSSANDRAESLYNERMIIEANSFDIGFCIGMLAATVDHAEAREPPLMRSYALRRIAEDEVIAVSQGRSQMETYFRVTRERARRGIVAGVGLFGGDVPTDTDALPADDTIAQIMGALVTKTGENAGN